MTASQPYSKTIFRQNANGEEFCTFEMLLPSKPGDSDPQFITMHAAYEASVLIVKEVIEDRVMVHAATLQLGSHHPRIITRAGGRDRIVQARNKELAFTGKWICQTQGPPIWEPTLFWERTPDFQGWETHDYNTGSLVVKLEFSPGEHKIIWHDTSVHCSTDATRGRLAACLMFTYSELPSLQGEDWQQM
ncbi:hypothetical protein DFH07DRAFT_1009280 [Mycena maculata]|uniref:Uncharacterized protein n=1 Tax=Mycena maculata TaxID=230809 RepID=A0AAD7JM87_9AGAR|nr:hypothetical protein DFH07DRAFT_1009280 [Mycena maculata]